jgi:hypothetical protein
MILQHNIVYKGLCALFFFMAEISYKAKIKSKDLNSFFEDDEE